MVAVANVTKLKSIIFAVMLVAFVAACSGPHMPLDRSAEQGADAGKAGSGGGGGSGTGAGGGSSNALTFQGKVGKIFATRCVPCHAPGGALPNWSDYNTAFGKKDRIMDRVVVKKTMPPPAASKLTDDERELIGKWLEAGAPKGDSAEQNPGGNQPTQPPAQPPTNPPTTNPPTTNPPTTNPPTTNPPTTPPTDIALVYEGPGGMKQWFAKNCSVCHDGSNPDMGTPNWQDYEQVFAKKDVMRKRILEDRDMPPGGFTGEGVELSEEQRMILKAWLDKGAPRK